MTDFRLSRDLDRRAASDKQVAYLRWLAGNHGLRPADVDRWLRFRWGTVAEELDGVTALWLIDELKGWRGVPFAVRVALAERGEIG